jgi:multiple sugar transport system substrate-binding protein
MLVVVLLLGACATPKPAATPVPATATPPAKGVVTLSYALWSAEQLPAHEKIIAAFQAKHPNIRVEPQVIPWPDYWSKLQTAIAGGQAYDVFWMNGPNFAVYAAKGALVDLQPLVERDGVDLSVYPPSLVQLYRYNGHIYGLPKDFDTIALFYNKDLFDAAGVAYPNENWTWDDLKAAAKALTTKDTWGIGVPVDAQCVWFNFVYQNGGKVVAPDGSKVLMDEPATCEAIKFLYSFIQEGLSPDAATMLSSDTETQLFPGAR